MSFTKEEIALCRKITEKHRKEINFGDWYLDYRDDSIGLYQLGTPFKNRTKVFPLWQISDCLEFLRKKGYWFRMERRPTREESGVKIWVFSSFDKEEFWMNCPSYEGKATLEACLKAVLAIVEES